MKKDNEQYKRMIRIFLVVILVACETSLFMYSWIKNYNTRYFRSFKRVIG